MVLRSRPEKIRHGGTPATFMLPSKTDSPKYLVNEPYRSSPETKPGGGANVSEGPSRPSAAGG